MDNLEGGTSHQERSTSAASAADVIASLENNSGLPPLTSHDEDEDDELQSQSPPPDEDEDEDSEDGQGDLEDGKAKERTDDSKPKPEDEDIPQLDPSLAAKLTDKEKDRWTEHWKGVRKREQELATQEADLQTFGKIKPYTDAFGHSEEAAGKSIRLLATAVAEHWNTTPEALLGSLVKGTPPAPEAPKKPAVDEWGNPLPEHEVAGFATKVEFEQDKRIKSLEAAIQRIESSVTASDEQRRETARQAEFKQTVDRVLPSIIESFKVKENGFAVTRTMVEQALTEFPKLIDDPVKAVKMMFVDELTKHYASKGVGKQSRAPEMAPPQRGRGNPPVDPKRMKAADVIARLENRS